jgi:putative hydrolase of the HAD superfamily
MSASHSRSSRDLGPHLHPTTEVVLLDAVGTVLTLSRSVADCYYEVAQRVGIDVSKNVIRERFPAAFTRYFTPWQSLLPPEWVALEQNWRSGRDLQPWSFQADSTRQMFEKFFALPVSEEGERTSWASLVADVLAPAEPSASKLANDAAFRHLWQLFAEPRSWQLMTGAASLVSRLQAVGLRVCLASNFDHRLRQIMAGFADQVQVNDVFVSSEVGFRKPDPRFYRSVLSRLSLPAEKVAMVGDRWWEDFAAPTIGGLQAFLFAPGSREVGPDNNESQPPLLQTLGQLIQT